ncbi:MAG: NTP transferase domain-containing protein [Myxococcota bacterium]
MLDERRCWAVIPARHGSRRIYGKVLADLAGRPMLRWVWERTCLAGFDRVLIATDDARVGAVASRFGAEVAYTGPQPSGTHRVAAVVRDLPVDVVNVQGDQPFLDPEALRKVRRALAAGAEVATLSAPYTGDPRDPARVKVTVDPQGRATEFTRQPRPEARLHVGVYGFGPGQIARCVGLPASARGAVEDLEQIAWLEGGVEIRVEPIDQPWLSVDREADLVDARDMASRESEPGGAGPRSPPVDPHDPPV